MRCGRDLAGHTPERRQCTLRVCDDFVADADHAVAENVGVDPGAMCELPDDPRPRHRLEVQARLAELDAVALDVADAEALPDEVVQPHAADGQLPSRLPRREADSLDLLGLHERQRLARLRPVRAEVAVALEPPPGECAHRLDRAQFAGSLRPEMDRLDHQTLLTSSSRRFRFARADHSSAVRSAYAFAGQPKERIIRASPPRISAARSASRVPFGQEATPWSRAASIMFCAQRPVSNGRAAPT